MDCECRQVFCALTIIQYSIYALLPFCFWFYLIVIHKSKKIKTITIINDFKKQELRPSSGHTCSVGYRLRLDSDSEQELRPVGLSLYRSISFGIFPFRTPLIASTIFSILWTLGMVLLVSIAFIPSLYSFRFIYLFSLLERYYLQILYLFRAMLLVNVN